MWGNLGYVALHRRQLEVAERRFTDSIKLFLGLGSNLFASDILVGFGAVAAARGHFERAARLQATASAVHESANTDFEPSEQQEFDRTLSSTCAALDEETFSSRWAEGSAISLQQAVDYAPNRPGAA